MKLGVYFRESWHNLRTDKLYTLVYIIAVAFSLAMVMTYLTVVAMRTQNSYPETHRDRMLSIPLIYLELGTTSSMEQSVSTVCEQGFHRSVPVRAAAGSGGVDSRENGGIQGL